MGRVRAADVGNSEVSEYPYAVTRDGQRFLVVADASQQQAIETPLTVVLDWTAGVVK